MQSMLAPIFESLKNPFQSPFCHITYVMAVAEFYPYMLKANEATDAFVQAVAKSLIMFYATPLEKSRCVELEGRLFRQPCRCLSIFPQLDRLHRYPHPRFAIRTGRYEITNLGAFITLLSELTDRLISVTQVSSNGDVRAWRRRMSHLVEKHGPALSQSFANWFGQEDSDDAQIFALFGTVLELCPKFMKEVESSERLRSAWVERMHKLVTAEHLAKEGTSPRINLIFHGAGCFAFVAFSSFNCNATPDHRPLDLDRLRACFPQATSIYDNICQLLTMASKASEQIQSGGLHDITRLAHFGAALHYLLESKPALSPLIKRAIEGIPPPPNGWMLFHGYFHILDRCSNHLRHSTLDTGSTQPSFEVAYTDRVRRGDRMLACSGCKASHYCSQGCQKASWKAETLPHRKVCSTLKKIFQVHEMGANTSGTPRDGEDMYRDAGISDAEVGEAIHYVLGMMEYLSAYKD
ncbi:hypothetical protein DFH06DRAFT_1194050 [Mycena polygramma]|nr:hypothetical protein DFH06DRAFT_1194050 [Mycena polygramma]